MITELASRREACSFVACRLTYMGVLHSQQKGPLPHFLIHQSCSWDDDDDVFLVLDAVAVVLAIAILVAERLKNEVVFAQSVAYAGLSAISVVAFRLGV